MKKKTGLYMALLLGLSVLTACSGSGAAETEEAAETVMIRVNVEGIGAVAVTTDGTDPEIDPEYPFSSHVERVSKGTQISAKGETKEDGWQFVRWMKNGEYFSSDETMKDTAEADTEYVAVFMMTTGYEGEAVTDIGDVKTIGDVLALPTYGYSSGMNKYVYSFELDNTVYQAIAVIDDDTREKLFDLDMDDPDYDRKQNEMIAPLPVTEIINITGQIPAQADLDGYVGKTFGELFDEGWSCSGWSGDEKVVYLDHTYFSYEAGFDVPENMDDFDEEKLAGLTVRSMTYTGIGDASYIDMD